MPQTLYDKIFESHLVHKQDDGTCLIYIDRHLVHEVTSPQAFEGLRMNNRKLGRHFGPETRKLTEYRIYKLYSVLLIYCFKTCI